MGRAIVGLIDRELTRMLGDHAAEEAPVLALKAEAKLAAREAQLAAREPRLEGDMRRTVLSIGTNPLWAHLKLAAGTSRPGFDRQMFEVGRD